jgi:hypothetical protein
MQFKRRHLCAGVAAAAVLVPSAAIGAGEGRPIDGGTRNPAGGVNRDYTRETQIIADTSTYGTRQSNKRVGDGGGAIYGCRSSLGREACVKASNLHEGRAFEFEARGREAGRITVRDTSAAPLTTNARGVATGLNADQVDGKSASEFAAAGSLKFAAVSAAGALGAARGATAAALTDAATETFTVTFDADVSRCSYTASAVGTADGTTVPAVSAGSDARTVVVDQADAGDADAFHLQVIC